MNNKLFLAYGTIVTLESELNDLINNAVKNGDSEIAKKLLREQQLCMFARDTLNDIIKNIDCGVLSKLTIEN